MQGGRVHVIPIAGSSGLRLWMECGSVICGEDRERIGTRRESLEQRLEVGIGVENLCIVDIRVRRAKSSDAVGLMVRRMGVVVVDPHKERLGPFALEQIKRLCRDLSRVVIRSHLDRRIVHD